MNILAVIPARKGSKRLPNKNIRKLNGIPLVEYAIKKCVEESGKIYRIYNAENKLELYTPNHHSIVTRYRRRFEFIHEVKQKLIEWVPENFR